MKNGYMIPHQWWILAAEAVRCYELLEGGALRKPTRPMSLKQKDLLRKLF